MKILNYAVSLQWGSGMHYFISTEFTTAEAATAAAIRVQSAAEHKAQKKKSPAKPVAHVWKLHN